MVQQDWVNILGVNVSVGTVPSSFDVIRSWIRNGEKHYVTVSGAHTMVECQSDTTLRSILNRAGMVTADGMPIVWMSRLLGKRGADRVYGPDLMRHALEHSRDGGVRHYLYGASEDTLRDLQASIERDYPGVNIVGSYAPPFRKVGEREDDEVLETINAAKPDIIWVSLSTPKQDYWMANHLAKLDAAALIGVGAAFDFLSGNKVQAPRFIQRSGTEWLFRMVTEPKRLAARYLDTVPRFMMLSGLQLAGLRKWPLPDRMLRAERAEPAAQEH